MLPTSSVQLLIVCARVHTHGQHETCLSGVFRELEWVLGTKAAEMFAGGETLKKTVFPTWKNLAEKVHFLLEVSMRELLVSWLHKVLAGVEEIL